MISISVNGLSLDYKLPRRFHLSRKTHSTNPAVNRIRKDQTGRDYVAALRDISFELVSGDRLALVGNNGAGKTTLLKTLYGIYEPTSGSVSVHGRVDALFNISLGFRPHASGRRNIMLRGLINGWSKKEIERKMTEIVEFTELGEFIDMPLDSYSAGMAARLAFAVATSLEPEILLMDEWIGAGDLNFQEKASKRMRELVETAGIVILASHNQSLLQRTCNKVLELEEGKINRFCNADEYFGPAEKAS